MKILVTGATGFIGSWMTKALVNAGHEVIILHRSSSDLSELKGVPYKSLIGDITDYDSVLNATQQVESVFHLAGYVGYSKAARILMEKVNVEGTKNIVKACSKSNIKRLLHFSSVVAVGAGFYKKDILNETSEYNVGSLNLGYFQTKHNAELEVISAVKSNLVDAVIVNPSTVYGPGDAKKGSRKTQVKVANGKFPFYTSGGVSVIHIEDVINATIQAWEKGRCGERYILSGENITIKELFQLISSASGANPPRIHLPNPVVHAIGKVGDVLEKMGKKGPLNSENAWTATMYHWFDNSKAKKELGLNPRSAREAIEESVQWMKENKYI